MQKSKVNYQKWLISYELIAATLSAAVTTFYAYFISFRILPLASGWIAFPLQDPNLIPYRDYFNPVTPLTYFIAQLTADNNFGLHNYMVASMWDVPIFAISCYLLGRLFANPMWSMMLSILMGCLLFSLRLEQIGGWNTQFLILSSTSFCFFIKSIVKTNRNQRSYIFGITSKQMYAVFSGFFASLSILAKQTVALSFILIAVQLFIWLFYTKENELSIKVFLSAKYFIIGSTPPMIFTTYFLLSNGAMGSFIKDMTSGGGKSPQFSKFPYLVATSIRNEYSNIFIFFIFFVFIFGYFALKKKIDVKLLKIHACHEYFALLITSFGLWRFSGLYNPTYSVTYFCEDMAIIALPFVIRIIIPTLRNSIFGLLAFVSFGFLFFTNLFDKGILKTNWNYLIGISDSNAALICITAALMFTVFFLNKEFSKLFEKVFSNNLNTGELSFSDFRFIIMFANFYSFSSLINLYSSGGGIYVQWFIPTFLIYICVFIYVCRLNGIGFIQVILGFAIETEIFSATALTLQSPYAWFNWSEPSLLVKHTDSHLPRNYGFQLSDEVASYYSEVKAGSQKAAEVSGAGSQSTVFSFSNIPNAAEASGLDNYALLMCPVLWFDVCPNSIANNDLVTFKKHPANVVIWQTMPTAYLIGDEKQWVHGSSALRNWEAYEESQVKSGTWVEVANFNSPISNGWQTQIFAIKP